MRQSKAFNVNRARKQIDKRLSALGVEAAAEVNAIIDEIIYHRVTQAARDGRKGVIEQLTCQQIEDAYRSGAMFRDEAEAALTQAVERVKQARQKVRSVLVDRAFVEKMNEQSGNIIEP
jgi:HPt (histidine-containing phosphotransfer) domain-containing protein